MDKELECDSHTPSEMKDVENVAISNICYWQSPNFCTKKVKRIFFHV